MSSICTKDLIAYLGCVNGCVLKIDLNTRNIIAKYQTNSQLPIINMKIVKDFIVLGTCQGEIHIVDRELMTGKVVSAHQSMIYLLLVD